MLFVFVFGYQSRAGVVDTGRFYCPVCRRKRRYKLRKTRRYITLYFVPAIPLGEGSEYIECDRCSGTFPPEVLSEQVQSDAKKRKAEYQRAIWMVLIHMVAADGQIGPDELATMRNVYQTVTDKAIQEDELRKELRRAKWGPSFQFFRSLTKVSRHLNDKGKEAVMEASFLVAIADGELGKPELKLLKEIGRHLGLKKNHVRDVIASLQRELRRSGREKR